MRLFIRSFLPSQIRDWKERTAPYFTFVPKMSMVISHLKRLQDVEEITSTFVESISHFGDKLGPVFIQNHNKFMPKDLAVFRPLLKIGNNTASLLRSKSAAPNGIRS